MKIKTYYYISGQLGLTANGGIFTKDRSRWMAFTEEEKNRIEEKNIKPYGVRKKRGTFVST